MNFLRLIRIKNLIIILITEIMIKYFLIDYFLSINNLSYRMSNVVFVLIASSSILIAGAANIHNDIQDKEIDAKAKPSKPIPSGAFSIKKARVMLFSFNSGGVILTFIAAYIIKEPLVAIFQLSILGLLFAYSLSLKCSKIIGNIIISISIAMVPVVVWVYTIYDTAAHNIMFNYSLRWMHISIFFLALFAFMSTLIREMIKDREDMKGDLDCGCITWASSVSPNTFRITIIVLSLLFVEIIALYQVYLPDLVIYRASFLIPQSLILFILIPRVFMAKDRKDFKKLSSFMKIITISGLLLPLLLFLTN